ncbi:MAG: GGDEF domain-containing protein [Gammaproteobacteria bacterium]|nr:GGDEF domain-containing protein [Gammaproteobacteria bacterium]
MPIAEITETTTSLNSAGADWRQRYRELCREYDAEKIGWNAQDQLLRQAVLKFSHLFVGVNEALDHQLATLRGELVRVPPVAIAPQALNPVVEACAAVPSSRGEPLPDAWAACTTLLDQLTLPEALAFEAKQLRARCQAGGELPTWLRRFAALLNDVAQVNAAPDESSAARLGVAELCRLLDWLLLPIEFEPRAKALRAEIASGTAEDPLLATGTFLNDLHAYLRRDVHTLDNYLKRATGELSAVELALQQSVDERRHSVAASQQFTEDINADMTEIARIIKGESGLSELKETIEGRVHSVRSSIAGYVAIHRTRQTEYEERIAELTRRVAAFEQEATNLRQTLATEQEKAYRDSLTQLPNRLAYDERAQLEILRARRTETSLALAVLDLDLFKQINDKYGHKVGDRVLRHVAAICRQRVRATDLLARYGGEEFVAVFPDTGVVAATEVCEELRRQIERAVFQFQGQRVPVTVSIGLTELAVADTLEGFFERADRALYKAKNAGRNRVVTETA